MPRASSCNSCQKASPALKLNADGQCFLESREKTMKCSSVMLGLLVPTVLPLSAAADEGEISVERGKQVSITHAGHDCHTAGYIESDGKLDPAAALKGSPIGWRGPWGTTYALNLRLTVAEKAKTEDECVEFAR